MRIGTLMKDALDVVWKHKRLWVFGLFVAGGAGSGGGGGGTSGGGAASGAATGAAASGAAAAESGGLSPTWLGVIIAAALVLVLLALLVHVVSEGALVAEVARTRGDGEVSLRRGLREGLQVFWPLLGVKVLAFLVFLFTGAVIAAPILALVLLDASPWAMVPVAVLLALLAVPWLLTVAFVYFWAMRFVVLEGRPAVDSVREATGLLHGRLLDALKVLLADAAGMLAAGLAGGLAAIFVLAVGLAVYAAAGLWPALVAGGVLALPFALALGGALGTWRSTVWTLGFLAARAPVPTTATEG